MSKHTPGPWKWWTSCSWRRLYRDDGRNHEPVLVPHVASDGHPDLTVKPDDMLVIAAAPDLLKAAETAYLRLLMNLADRHKHQSLLCLLRDSIAMATGRDPEEVQNEFEADAVLAIAESRP